MSDFECQGLRHTGTWKVMPFGRDEDLFGRKDIIKVIDKMFSNSKSARRVALVGLGGVGGMWFDPEESKII